MTPEDSEQEHPRRMAAWHALMSRIDEQHDRSLERSEEVARRLEQGHLQRMSAWDALPADSERPHPGDTEHAATLSRSSGALVPTTELLELGFLPFELRFVDTDLPEGNCEWDTVGDVPESAGLYAFTIGHPDDSVVSVAYVGMTTHLWMVTKGRLPDGSSRPAQRYGRYKYAGTTRARVNAEISRLRASGATITHWLLPVQASTDAMTSTLREAEEQLIRRWDLRRVGWNRG